MGEYRKTSLRSLLILTATIALIGCLLPRIPQPQSYPMFADRRGFLRIPNFGDVFSNLSFAAIGIWGLVFLLRSHFKMGAGPFLEEREIWPYLFAFIGLLLTAFGSSYYHLAPDNARLLWDRLPMTITFMSMAAAVITERVSLRLGLCLLPVLLFVGFLSVLQWYWSEIRGTGDLRFYAAVQVYSALVIVLTLFMPPRYTRGSGFGFALGFYALAKALEIFDKPIFTEFHVVSGHTLKHVAAAAAGYYILRMLQKRKPVTVLSPSLSPGWDSVASE